MSSRQRITFSAAASALTLSVLQPASLAVGLAAGETERDAQLLVCGSFPDKKLNITEKDLDAIVASFSADTVPIKVEHVDSPLDPLGFVSKLWRDGKSLMAKIAFDSDAAPLLAKRPIGRLSVGLDRDTQSKALSLREVSLVMKPRVASAALLSDDSENKIALLSAQLLAADVDAKILTLKQAGKITPAIEPMARALLSAGETAAITLSDGSSVAVADTTYSLLSALPPLVKFGETAANLYGGPGGAAGIGEQDEEEELTPAQTAYARDVLKVDPAKVRTAMHAHKNAQKAKGA